MYTVQGETEERGDNMVTRVGTKRRKGSKKTKL